MFTLRLAAGIAALGFTVALTTTALSSGSRDESSPQDYRHSDAGPKSSVPSNSSDTGSDYLAANFSAAADCPWFLADARWWSEAVVVAAAEQHDVHLDAFTVYAFAADRCGIEV